MIPAFRILPRLNPLKSENLLYLASSAVLTRFAVAGVRVWENTPSKNKNPDYNRVDKYSALWERIFVELFGTLGYMATIHAGMDMMANIFEKNIQLPILDDRKGKVKAFPRMSQAESIKMVQKVNEAIHDVYGQSNSGVGLIDRAIFGLTPEKRATRKNLLTKLEKLGVDIGDSALMKRIMGNIKTKGSLEHFISEINKKCTATVSVGILLGALFGGVIIQFANDRLFSPYVVPFVNKVLGISNKPRQISYQNNPFSNYDVRSMSMGWTGNSSESKRTFKF